MIDLKDLTPKEIELFCFRNLGRKPGQGTRVSVWLYRKKAEDFDSMADLNRPFREELKRQCTISQLTVGQKSKSEGPVEEPRRQFGGVWKCFRECFVRVGEVPHETTEALFHCGNADQFPHESGYHRQIGPVHQHKTACAFRKRRGEFNGDSSAEGIADHDNAVRLLAVEQILQDP